MKPNNQLPPCPKRIIIAPDNYHAQHVGETVGGKQFFITSLFDYLEESRQFLAVFLWDKQGEFLEAQIDHLGTREQLSKDPSIAQEVFQKKIKALGPYRTTSIEVAPFEVKQFDTQFGLLYTASIIEGHIYQTVELHPGNFMAFYPPWNGSYDT